MTYLKITMNHPLHPSWMEGICLCNANGLDGQFIVIFGKTAAKNAL